MPIACALAMLMLVPVAYASHGGAATCEEDGKNIQCSEFGKIGMVNQEEIRGEPIVVTAEVQVDDTYADAGARWIMFSIRHDDPTGNSPVSLSLKSFRSPDGELFITRTDHDVPNELNLWVHVVDVPVGQPLTLEVEVGAADRGAFQLETLVMPFDRGYEPIKDATGEDRTLYAATLLGVNEETSAASGGSDGGSVLSGRGVPGFTFVPVVIAALAAMAIVGRRKA